LTNSPPMSTEPPNEENSQVFTVDKDAAGKRLDAFLSESIEGWSRARLQRLIEGGDVLVNAKAAKPSYKLREGDEIDVDLVEAPVERFVPENIPLDIVYEDEFLAVVNKPAGMVVHPGAGVSNGTLANAIAWHFQSVPPAVAGGSPQSPSAVDPTESDANIQPPATAGGTDIPETPKESRLRPPANDALDTASAKETLDKKDPPPDHSSLGCVPFSPIGPKTRPTSPPIVPPDRPQNSAPKTMTGFSTKWPISDDRNFFKGTMIGTLIAGLNEATKGAIIDNSNEK
jgi:ribosomal 50S subunit-recycling heat shock protein